MFSFNKSIKSIKHDRDNQGNSYTPARLLAFDPQIRLITAESIPGMPVVKTLLPAQVQVIQ